MKNDSRGKTTRAESEVRGWSEFFLFVFFRLSGSSDKDCLGRADYARETNVGRAQKKILRLAETEVWIARESRLKRKFCLYWRCLVQPRSGQGNMQTRGPRRKQKQEKLCMHVLQAAGHVRRGKSENKRECKMQNVSRGLCHVMLCVSM